MHNEPNSTVDNDEFLYRGVIEVNWDFENNRPSSSTFKDSLGVSVDRDSLRTEEECINFLEQKKDFFCICKVVTGKIRALDAFVKYVPKDDNIYHSEIHDSEERVQMRGSKPKKIRDIAEIVKKK